ncbi:MAG: MFS transporter [Candidatus Gastranaerophilaceae bacterium]
MEVIEIEKTAALSSKFDFNIYKFNLALFLRSILLLTPIYIFLYQENGLTVKDLFLFQGIFYLASILFEIPVGYLSDNIERKNLLLISFMIFIGFYSLWFFFHGYYVILAGEILFAISKVMMDNALSGYLYDYLNSQNKQSTMVKHYGYLNFYLAVGTALAGLIGVFLYSKFGLKTVIGTEIFIVSLSFFLILSLPNIKYTKYKTEIISQKAKGYFKAVKDIYKNDLIICYVFYSGLLTSFSILFALSFQPLMQNALFPVFLYGVVAFINHFVRALSGVVAGKYLRNFNIKKIVIPLFCLYILAFLCIFKILAGTNILLLFFLLTIICLIIGVQVIFTILHVSRLHKFVTIEQRGTLMAVNNFVSRIMVATMLISSQLFIDNSELISFFSIAFYVFLVLGFFFMVKIIKLKEQV